MPACSEKLSGWLTISLWPEGYGLLKCCLKTKTKPPKQIAKKKKKLKPNRRSCFVFSKRNSWQRNGLFLQWDLAPLAKNISKFLYPEPWRGVKCPKKVSLLIGPGLLRSACWADSLSPLSMWVCCQSLPGCFEQPVFLTAEQAAASLCLSSHLESPAGSLNPAIPKLYALACVKCGP